MPPLLGTLKKNAGVALLSANLLLLVLLFFAYDPFGLHPGGYESASPLLEVSEEELTSVEILFPGAKDPVRLTRGKPAPGVSFASGREKSEESKESLPRFRWELSYPGGEKSYRADARRMGALLQALREARRYYSLKLEDRTRKEYGFTTGDGGECDCLALRLHFRDESEVRELYVGRSSIQGNRSYAYLKGEERIYQLKSDLRSEAGDGVPDFFRNRDLVADRLSRDEITSLHARFKNREVSLSSSGAGWRMLLPVNGPVQMGSLDALLSDIGEWRARSFPDALPPDVDKSAAFTLQIVYKKSGDITEAHSLNFEVLGKGEYDTYFLRTQEGVLAEVRSYYLEDLFHPEERLLQRKREGETPLP